MPLQLVRSEVEIEIEPSAEERGGMADEEQGSDRRSGRGRREDDSTPPWRGSIWTVVFSVLVTILISLTSVMLSKLSTIESSLREERDARIRSEERYAQIKEEMGGLAGRVATIERAYQYNVNNRLTMVEATVGIKTRPMTQPDRREEGD